MSQTTTDARPGDPQHRASANPVHAMRAAHARDSLERNAAYAVAACLA